MRTRLSFVVAVALVALVALPVAAQNPTGTLTGRVIHEGEPLPGVTVTVSSPALQGVKSAVTNANGDYLIPFLPPGTYRVSMALAGFRTVEYDVKISAAQQRTLDAVMDMESFEDVIEVRGAYETISDSLEAATTYEQTLIEELPVARTLESAVLLAPGVQDSGPGGDISIAGSQSFENLWLINGVVVNENVRGQSLPLFIEDAIQETTTITSGVSAEYGRFQGGVVNMLTKSGGNEFSGSLRANLTNDDWISSNNDLAPERVDDINQSYEGTLGGFVLKDHLWFFLAGRDESRSESRTTDYTNIPYSFGEDEKRYEAKFTLSPNPQHRVVASYIEIDQVTNNTDFGTILDLASLNPNREDPQDIMALNYNGVFGENMFLEAQYSERNYSIGVGSGSPYTDILRGTLLLDRSRGSARYHTPTFCSAPECGEETRDNENWLAKGTYFLSTDTWGSHELVAGYDHFNDMRQVDNHQQGSDFRLYCSSAIITETNEIYPVCAPRGYGQGLSSTFYRWTPIFLSSEGTDFATDSFFVNDTWRYNERLTFNVGFRYDVNDGVDSSGNKVADDSKISPRLGASWDVKGDGDVIVNASYGHYVAGLANGIADNSSLGGNPAWTLLWYDGPCLNCDQYLSGDLTGVMTQEEVIQAWYDWFQANGGTDTLPGFSGGDFPGFTPQILDSLSSPHTVEYSLGVTKRLGQRGLVRADYVHRDGKDFYVDRSQVGRTVDTGFIGELDVITIENDDSFYERVYDGLHTSASYRLSDRLTLGGNWTWSHARGNFDGETSASGPVTGVFLSYPEYREERWNAPRGNLDVDRRHKARAWGVWRAIANDRHTLSVSLLQNFWSGAPYSIFEDVNVEPYVDNPGYLNPPDEVTYYFSGRNSLHWDDVTRTDLSLNYSFFLPVAGQDIEMFIQPEVLNLFNESAQIGGRTTIRLLDDFNPFTENPVEGTHWEKPDNFGDPVSENDFQEPRTYRVSVGLRF